MQYKEINRAVYELYAGVYETRSATYREKWLREDTERFIRALHGKKVLDLGSGPGRDAAYFKTRGLIPVSLDYSPEMLARCRKKNLISCLGDLESLPFCDATFDGVWAYTSLLHMPKAHLPHALGEVRRVLKPTGAFYLGMKEGIGEKWVTSKEYPGCKRFFSFYKDSELRRALLSWFSIEYASRIEVGNAIYLNYLCQRA